MKKQLARGLKAGNSLLDKPGICGLARVLAFFSMPTPSKGRERHPLSPLGIETVGQYQPWAQNSMA